MVTWWGLLALVLYTAAAVALGALWAQDRHRTKAFNAEIEQGQAGRHRVSEPRAALPDPPPGDRLMGKQPQPTGQPRWVDTDKPGRRRTSLSGQDRIVREQKNHRQWTDAASIAPVMWTVPGKPQAAPSKHGADETGRMIRLDTATTGEIRAVGDRLVAAIEKGETP